MPAISIHDIGERTCQYEGCEAKATHLAVGRACGDAPKHPVPAYYCREHAYAIADEGHPEYHSVCPNCGCLQGVN